MSADRTELRVTLACGVSRCGKTIFFLRYLIARPELACRFIFDPLGKMAEQLGLVCAETLEELHLALEDGWVCFDPEVMFSGDHEAAFNFFCEWSYTEAQRLGKPTAFLADEIWQYQSRQKMPLPLARWIKDGAKHGCECCFATHEPQLLNSSIKGHVTELVVFYLQEKKALEYVADFGISEDEVRSLANGSFIARDPRTRGELRGKVF